MALSVNVKFDQRPASADKGKIVITATEGSTVPGDNWELYFTLTAPDDSVILGATDFGGVGNLSVAFPGTDSLTVDIPLDSDGNYLKGNYNLQAWKRVVTDVDPLPAEELIVDVTYDFCPHNTPLNTGNSNITTSETLNCLTGALTGNDDTDYDALSLTRTSRTLTIDPPAIDGRADVTATDADVTITVAYANVTYPITYAIEYTYDSVTADAELTILSAAGILKTVDYLIDCGGNLCSTLTCLKTYFDTLKTKATSLGGWARLPEADKGNFALISAYVNLAFGFKSCGNTVKQTEAINAARALLSECACTCADCDTTDPIPFTA